MRLLIILFLFLTLNAAKAGIVEPVYKQYIDSNLDDANNAPSPTTIKLTPDGKKVFIGSHSDTLIYIYDLSTPFDISTLDPSERSTVEINGLGDDLWSGGNKSIEFNNDGTKIFILVENGLMQAHNLPSPYDVASISASTIIADDGIRWNTDYPITNTKDLAFNNDGTKMYINDGQHNSDDITEFNLSTPFDPSTVSSTSNLNTSSLTARYTMEMSFDDDGTRLYLSESGTSAAVNYIYVWKLSEPFSISSATYINKWPVTGNGNNMSPYGWTFANAGMKLYITTEDSSSDGDDLIYEYDLSCPYGIVICETDSITSVGAQVEFAKHVIQQNTSTIFKRFDWIRRNEGKNNLNSNNINLNIYNPVLSSLKKQLKSSFNEKVYSQVSLDEKKTKIKKNKNWSYWSHGDISFGRNGDTATSKPKEIRISGLMFGADKKINNNKFVGAAIRFGKGEIQSISPGGIELDTESLTLNLYSTLDINNNSNLNALFGASLLRIDQLLSNEITGERNGKQVFTAFNLESKDSYGNFNIRPTGKFEFGVTQFSEYTDFGTSSSNSQDIYDSLTFKTGNIAAGFKFDNSIDINNGRLSRNGSLEYIRDLTSNIDYNFKNDSDNVLVTKTVETHSIHNIKSNFGFEALFDNGYTLALNYERFQGLDYSSHQDSILFKFGHIREEESDFAFNYKPLQNNQMEISYIPKDNIEYAMSLDNDKASLNYKRNYNDFDFKISSNYNIMSQIPDYGANIEVSTTF